MLKKFVKLKLRYQAYLEEESKIRKKSFIILAKSKLVGTPGTVCLIF